MAGAGWRELGPEEWGAHPLNRVCGWMTPIAVPPFIERSMEGALVLSRVVTAS